MSKKALIIFQKNLIPGQVKTRLAATIGNEKALEVYKELVQLTYLAVSALNVFEKRVYYSDFIPLAVVDSACTKHMQLGLDLGEKMSAAFEETFALGFDRVVIIGTDCPKLTKEVLEAAFSYLDKADLVIGPALDGGYYLLGMNRFWPGLFHKIEWSTPHVFVQTLKAAADYGLVTAQLVPLRDLDTEADLEYFKGLENVVKESG